MEVLIHHEILLAPRSPRSRIAENLILRAPRLSVAYECSKGVAGKWGSWMYVIPIRRVNVYLGHATVAASQSITRIVYAELGIKIIITLKHKTFTSFISAPHQSPAGSSYS